MADKPRTYPYFGDCASVSTSDVKHLREMIDKSRTISRRSFCRWVLTEDRLAWERGVGYATNGRSGMLTAARDWAIAYYRSTWRGVPCVYLTWSAYEVIFVAPGVYRGQVRP
jgi:hypothetical protein